MKTRLRDSQRELADKGAFNRLVNLSNSFLLKQGYVTRRAFIKEYEKTLHHYQCYILHLPYMQLQAKAKA